MKVFAALGLLLLCSQPQFAQTPAQPPDPPPAQTTPPASPAKTQVGKSTYEETESVWSIGVTYWRPQGFDSKLAGGTRSPDPAAQTSDLPGKPGNMPGVTLMFPVGHSNRIEVSGFQAKSSGQFIAPRAYTFFSQSFKNGEFLVQDQRLRAAKLTFNYLSFPAPPLDARLRVKTLWELQYVQVQTHFVAPLTAKPAVGTTAAIPATETKGRRTIFLPTVGLGIELIPSLKHFRLEGRGTAMAFPGRSQIWDVEGTATGRIGNFEIFAGGRLFHYRSTVKNEQYVEGNMWGPMAGIRWTFY